MIKTISAILALLWLWGFPTASLQAKSKSNVKVCKKHRTNLKKYQEELNFIKTDLKGVDEQMHYAQQEWDDYRVQMSKISGCSEGNKNNTPKCTQLLDDIRAVGNSITELKKHRGKQFKKKLPLENKILTAQSNLTNFQCPK